VTRKKKKKDTRVPHRYYLYTAAVQSVEADLKFYRRIYEQRNGRKLRRLREDFCGTALLCWDWVRRGADHEAWGVDRDRAPLAWGLEHYAPRVGGAVERLHLLNRDVLDVTSPRVDLIVASNFSYSVFKTRQELGRYFRTARRSLDRGGLFVLDAWGGQEVMGQDVERRRIAAEEAFDGTKVPAFTYCWEQKRFNPIDHHILCHIHFRMRGGRRLRRAFTYDWRLWTLPEIRELLSEAGFRTSEVFVDGWDEDEKEGDGVFRRRIYFENQAGWIAYVAAYA
jgi:hypothetical protein